MGYGLLTLKPHEYRTLHDAEREEGMPIATIGAGTGLGECYLTAGHDGRYSCYASEGGHVDFAPANALERELYQTLQNEFGSDRRVSVERIVSGPGLANIYRFLALKYPEKVDKTVHQAFVNAHSMQGKVVGTNAKTNELCNQAMEILVECVCRFQCNVCF